MSKEKSIIPEETGPVKPITPKELDAYRRDFPIEVTMVINEMLKEIVHAQYRGDPHNDDITLSVDEILVKVLEQLEPGTSTAALFNEMVHGRHIYEQFSEWKISQARDANGKLIFEFSPKPSPEEN